LTETIGKIKDQTAVNCLNFLHKSTKHLPDSHIVTSNKPLW